MPNWTENTLTIEGPNEDLERFMAESSTLPDYYYTHGWAEEERRSKPCFCFSGLCPIPEDVLRDYISARQELERRYSKRRGKVRNFLYRHLHGKPRSLRRKLSSLLAHALGRETDEDVQQRMERWYPWSLNFWGTKWDIDGSARVTKHPDWDPPTLEISFDTAWAPPLGWLAEAARQFPSLTLYLEYEEPGMCFAGEAVAKGGKIIRDECHEMDEEELRRRHPDWDWEPAEESRSAVSTLPLHLS